MIQYILTFFLFCSALFAQNNSLEQMVRKPVKKVEISLNEIGLKPYKTNYLLPFGYTHHIYKSPFFPIDYAHKEAELQVSLQLKIGENLFGLHEKYYASYSHQAFWQLYIDSAPFRETTYNPEGFIVFPIEYDDSFLNLKSFKIALSHKSNGQPNTQDIVLPSNQSFNLSRSINYFYCNLRFKHGKLITDLSHLEPLLGSDNLSDNPDLMEYLGKDKIKFTYFIKNSIVSLMARGNLHTKKGAIELTYSYPILKSQNFYVKYFNGYVESLIDYKESISKISIGFSFSQ